MGQTMSWTGRPMEPGRQMAAHYATERGILLAGASGGGDVALPRPGPQGLEPFRHHQGQGSGAGNLGGDVLPVQRLAPVRGTVQRRDDGLLDFRAAEASPASARGSRAKPAGAP